MGFLSTAEFKVGALVVAIGSLIAFMSMQVMLLQALKMYLPITLFMTSIAVPAFNMAFIIPAPTIAKFITIPLCWTMAVQHPALPVVFIKPLPPQE